MTELLFREDAYLNDAPPTVVGYSDEGGVILDRTIFYPQGGGQPGDSGSLSWAEGQIDIATTIKGDADAVVLVPGEPSTLPAIGAEVSQSLNWDHRYRLMRIHTALHLLSVVIPLPVSGGAIAAEKGRLDFNMPEALENKEALQEELNALISSDLPVTESWITDEELAANPSLVKTMSVMPPTGAGRVRLIRIGEGADQVDLQPCGGTHVARTAEIGPVRLGKVEKKGKQNRRVYLHFDA